MRLQIACRQFKRNWLTFRRYPFEEESSCRGSRGRSGFFACSSRRHCCIRRGSGFGRTSTGSTRARRAAWIEDIAGLFGPPRQVGRWRRGFASAPSTTHAGVARIGDAVQPVGGGAVRTSLVKSPRWCSWMVIVLLVLLVACLTFASADVAGWAATLMSLAARFLGGRHGFRFFQAQDTPERALARQVFPDVQVGICGPELALAPGRH